MKIAEVVKLKLQGKLKQKRCATCKKLIYYISGRKPWDCNDCWLEYKSDSPIGCYPHEIIIDE